MNMLNEDWNGWRKEIKRISKKWDGISSYKPEGKNKQYTYNKVFADTSFKKWA